MLISKYLYTFSFDGIFINTNEFENLFCCMIKTYWWFNRIKCQKILLEGKTKVFG